MTNIIMITLHVIQGDEKCHDILINIPEFVWKTQGKNMKHLSLVSTKNYWAILVGTWNADKMQRDRHSMSINHCLLRKCTKTSEVSEHLGGKLWSEHFFCLIP